MTQTISETYTIVHDIYLPEHGRLQRTQCMMRRNGQRTVLIWPQQKDFAFDMQLTKEQATRALVFAGALCDREGACSGDTQCMSADVRKDVIKFTMQIAREK